MKSSNRLVIALALASLSAAGAYAGLMVGAGQVQAQEGDPIIGISPAPGPIYLCPPPNPTPRGNNPAPWPRPIQAGPGQPLFFNPVTACPGSDHYSIKVMSGTARIVTRRFDNGSTCPTYYEWFDGVKHEPYVHCDPLHDEAFKYDPGLWIWFQDCTTPLVLEVDCDCDSSTEPVEKTLLPPCHD